MNPKDSPTASERAEGPADERAAFEAYWARYGLDKASTKDWAWAAWLARSRLAAATPSGWVMVPVEPDPEMVWAGEVEFSDHHLRKLTNGATEIYRAMLAASPSPRTPEQPEPNLPDATIAEAFLYSVDSPMPSAGPTPA